MGKMTIENSRPGNYKMEVLETGLSTGKNSGFPQSTLRLKATALYVEDKELMDHFGLEDPQWVDWSEYDEEIVAFCSLFKANVNEGEQCIPGENDIFWYQALQDALGWDGAVFDDFAGDAFVSKIVQVWVAEDTYNGNTRLQVKGIDVDGAPVARELRKVDDETLKKMNSLLVGGGKKAAGKPAGKPKLPVGKPAASGTASAPSTPTPPPVAPTPPAAPSAPTSEEPSPPADDAGLTTKGLPANSTKDESWALLIGNKGDNDDSVIGEAFVAAMQEVSDNNGGIGDNEFTGEHWARVRDLAIRDLSLQVA